MEYFDSQSTPEEAVERHLLVGRPHGPQGLQVGRELAREAGDAGRQRGGPGVAGLGVGRVPGARQRGGQGTGARVARAGQAPSPRPRQQLGVGGQLGLGGAEAGTRQPHPGPGRGGCCGVHPVRLQQLHVARGEARGRGGARHAQPGQVGVITRHRVQRVLQSCGVGRACRAPRCRQEARTRLEARGAEGGVCWVIGAGGRQGGELWCGGQQLHPGLDDG